MRWQFGLFVINGVLASLKLNILSVTKTSTLSCCTTTNWPFESAAGRNVIQNVAPPHSRLWKSTLIYKCHTTLHFKKPQNNSHYVSPFRFYFYFIQTSLLSVGLVPGKSSVGKESRHISSNSSTGFHDLTANKQIREL